MTKLPNECCMLFLSGDNYFNLKVLFFISLETVADVDDVLGEMFLEEIQPTEEQLIVSIHVHVCTVQ